MRKKLFEIFRFIVCRHTRLRFAAASGAEFVQGGGVQVGIVARCAMCGYAWDGNVRTGCPGTYSSLGRMP